MSGYFHKFINTLQNSFDDFPIFDSDKALLRIWLLLKDVVHHNIDYISMLAKAVFYFLDAMFVPSLIAKQLMVMVLMQLILVGWDSAHSITMCFRHRFTIQGQKEKQLLEQLTKSQSYSEWKAIAQKLDTHRRLDHWRNNPDSSLYDYNLIKRRIERTKEMLDRGDIFDLMFRMRGALARDQFGILHEKLFTKALAGPKHLIEHYHETMARALNFICDSPLADEEIPLEVKLAFFNETRHAYGRTALLLSGGAFLGYYHIGVVRALFEEGLLSRVLSGAWAGSIVVAILGTKTDQELKEHIFKTDGTNLPQGLRTDFFLFSDEFLSETARRLNYLVPQGLRWLSSPLLSSLFDRKLLNLDTEHFKKVLMQNCGLYTFQEAFDRTGRIINIIVAPADAYDPPRLLNYLTAPHVCVWSAAAASCALPGIFDPINLIVKEPNGQYHRENEWTRQAISFESPLPSSSIINSSDGSFEDNFPMEQLSELFNVNHFIISQANPHSALLSSLSFQKYHSKHHHGRKHSSFFYNCLIDCVRFLSAQCRDWLKNIFNFIVFRSIASSTWNTKRGLGATLTQEYEGRRNDITITPWEGHVSIFRALFSAIKNPTGEEYNEICTAAEVNTWSSLARIRAHCLIEMTLDQCVQRLHKRIAEENERTRRLTTMNVLKQVAKSNGN